jgi:hypothetical protein
VESVVGGGACRFIPLTFQKASKPAVHKARLYRARRRASVGLDVAASHHVPYGLHKIGYFFCNPCLSFVA